MADKPTKSDKSPDQSLMRMPETTLTFYAHQSVGERAWDSLKADVRFCILAIKQEHAESGWYKLMSAALSRTNKIVSAFVGSGLFTLTVALIYTYREFLLNHKRWVAIILLSILSMFLMWLVRTTRRFHERTVRTLNEERVEEERRLKGQRDSFTESYNAERANLITSYEEKIAELERTHEEKHNVEIASFKSQLSDKEREIENLRKERPDFMGSEILEVLTQELPGPPKRDEEAGVVIMLPTEPIGTIVTLCVHIVNRGQVETTIKHFRLVLSVDNETYHSKYPYEGRILQSVIDKEGHWSTNEEPLLNLNGYLNSHIWKRGVGVLGYLEFEVKGVHFETIKGKWHITLRIYDALGEVHNITKWGLGLRQSQRLISNPEEE